MSEDRAALEELLRASRPGAIHLLMHYLYLPTRQAAAEVASELRGRGFKIEQRLGADGVNWLVLASHAVVLSEEMITSVRHEMEALTATRGGEYDGWEAAVE